MLPALDCKFSSEPVRLMGPGRAASPTLGLEDEDAATPCLSAPARPDVAYRWTGRAAAVAFYQLAFGATVMHHVADAVLWVAKTGSAPGRFSPSSIGGATGRTLLVVAAPDALMAQALGAEARDESPVEDEHGWRLGRLVDPFSHEWEVGTPAGLGRLAEPVAAGAVQVTIGRADERSR